MIKILYAYQEKLADKERLVKEMESSLPLVELRKLKTEFDAEKALFLQRQRNIAELKKGIHQKGDQAEMISEKIRTIEKLLYGGTITNGRELSALEEQGKSMLLEKDRSEKEILKIEEILEKENNELAQIAGALKQRQQQFVEMKKILSNKKEEYEERIRLITVELEALSKNIDKEELEWFYAERGEYQGKPLALVVNGDICNGCHRRNPPFLVKEAIAKPKTVRCDFCGRFLCE